MNQKGKMLTLVLIIAAFILAGLFFMNSGFNRAIEQDGYEVYIVEQEYYTGVQKNEKYWMTISPSI